MQSYLLRSGLAKKPILFSAYAFAGLAAIWKYGILRGQPKDSSLVRSAWFLRGVRLYFFSLFWLPIHHFSSALSYISLLYLPSFLDLSEYLGGRQSPWLKNGPIAQKIKSYFKSALVRTVEINEPKCVFALHPHGVMPFGSIINISSNVSHFEELFPSLCKRVVIAATGCFILPGFRDLILAAGVVDCTRFSVERWIENDYTVCIYPGGTREALYSNPDVEVLDLKRKLGFLQLCMHYDVPVVPCYTFNEVDHFSQVSYDKIRSDNPIIMFLRTNFQYTFGIMLPFLKNLVPRAAPDEDRPHLVTVVGSPFRLKHVLVPSDGDLQESMEIYVNALKELYDKYAPIYSSSSRKLIVT